MEADSDVGKSWAWCDAQHHSVAMIMMHYDDVIIGAIASQITSLTIVYSTVYSGADQSKHQSSASLAFVWGIHRGSVNSPHKWPVTRKMFPFVLNIFYLPHFGYSYNNYHRPLSWGVQQCAHIGYDD